MNAKLIMSVVAGVCSGAAVFADDGTWNGTGGESPAVPLQYLTPANWNGSVVGQGVGCKAVFPSAGAQYIRLDSALTIGRMSCSKGSMSGRTLPRLFGDGRVRLSANAGASSSSLGICGIELFLPIDYDSSVSGAWNDQAAFCGDITCAGDFVVASACQFRLDRYANSDSEVRVNPWPTGKFNIGNASASFFAPQGSEEVTGRWVLTEKSDIMTRVSGSAEHAIAAGTRVSCAAGGIPDGTFVKRVFDNATVQLSAAASVSSPDAEVVFAAFTPDVRQRFASAGAMASNDIYLNKYRDEDGLRIEVGTFAFSGGRVRTVDCVSGKFPGTLVLDELTGYGRLRLGRAHLELARNGTYGADNLPFVQTGSSAETRLTVTNGLAASIASMTNLVGTVIKDGSGSLTLGLNTLADKNTGSVVVERGLLTLDLSVSDVLPLFAAVTVKAGATLELLGGGVRCQTFSAESGATIRGPGQIYAAECGSLDGVILVGGASVVLADPKVFDNLSGAYDWNTPLAEVPGEPAFWVDASADSFEFAEDSQTQVKVWKDVRGDGYPKASYNTLCPTLVRDANGRGQHVYFKGDSSTSTKSLVDALWWDKTFSNVRAVFKVINCREGGGQLLGGTSYAWRPAGGNCGEPLFWESTVASRSAIVNGEFRVNGEVRSWKNGYPYKGGGSSTDPARLVPMTIDYQFAGNVNAGSFAYNSSAGRNGNERLYEYILYTNKLTKSEQNAVRQYLMNKWQRAEVNYEELPAAPEIAALDPAGETVVVPVAENREVKVAVAKGTGVLEKTGAGNLLIDDLSDAGFGLHVKAGHLTVKSMEVTRETLPGDPILHVDGADLSTITTNAKGKITAWQDCRGGNHTVTVPFNSSELASVKADGLNGLPMVDFGVKVEQYGGASAMRDLKFDEIPNVRTLFSVIGSQRGNGGPLVGNTTGLDCIENGNIHGMLRMGGGTYPGKDYPDWYLLRPQTFSSDYLLGCYDSGATRAQTNGVPVNLKSSILSGGYDLVSVATYQDFGASGFTTTKSGQSYYSGCQVLGESILYTNTLSRESVRRVESYLNRKWFGKETLRYRAAVTASLAVDEGAVLKVTGGTPITTSLLCSEGEIDGDVAVADGGKVVVAVQADGTVLSLGMDGTLLLAGGGTLELTGNVGRVRPGRYLLAEGFDGDVANWTVAAEVGKTLHKPCALVALDGKLYLDVQRLGMAIIVR